MKTRSSIIILVLLTMLFNCKKEPLKVAPTVTMTPVTNITSVSVSTGGTVTADGGATVTARGVCWSSTNKTPTTVDGNVSSGTGLGSFTSPITGLTPGTSYYVNAYATNSIGTSYSSTSTFTTLAIAPVITTTELTNITTNTATSGGTILNDGGSPVTARGVCWSTNQNPTIADSKTADGTGTGNFTSNLINLKTGTTYYVRAYATNSIGTTYGNQVTTYSKEENILFTITPDNSNGVITTSSATIEFKIVVSTAIPQQGVIYSIDLKRIDTNASVFKLDSTSVQSNMTIKVPGFNLANNFSLTISVTSKSTITNKLSKVISVTNPLALFQGYKVAINARRMGEEYWLRGTGIPMDLYVPFFQKPLPNQYHVGYFQALTTGDFNNDGWLDVFNSGGSITGPQCGFSFLIWNPITKVFDDKNLLNDKSFLYFGGNKNKAIPVFLNDDDYIDVVIFDNGDEGIPNSPNEPIRLVLSDGKGGYDLKEIETNENETFLRNGQIWKFGNKKEGGDVGDLNGDGIPDLVITENSLTYIYWGIKFFPFFTKENRAIICADDWNFGGISNNGFGERAPHCSGNSFDAQIIDFNKDGKNDILLCVGEDPINNLFPMKQRILINLGNGRFNNSSVIELPYYASGYVLQDYVVDDLNGDGLNDIIALTTKTYSNFTIYVFIQQKNGEFVIDKDWIQYKTNESQIFGSRRLNYFDFDKDGKKDIGYIFSGSGNVHADWGDNVAIKGKTIFKREGNQFIEQDFYQFDPYANSVVKMIK